MDDDAEKRQRNRERWCQTRLRALSPLSLRKRPPVFLEMVNWGGLTKVLGHLERFALQPLLGPTVTNPQKW